VELPRYAREQRVLLRHYLEQGLSKTEIARSLQVSRRTVYHWIDTDGNLSIGGPLAPCGASKSAPPVVPN
jgi:transposase-like protein